MKFYKFGRKFETDDQLASAQITEEEYKMSGLENPLRGHYIWQDPTRVKMDLVPMYEGRIDDTQFGEQLRVRYDLLRKTVSIGTLLRVISPELKVFLEQFVLSPHGFYPVELTHDLTKESRDYYLWHTLNIVTKEVIYPESEFELITKRTKELIRTYGKGTFENEDQYTDVVRDELYERRNLLRPIKLYYVQPYEVLPAGVDDIVISEKVKRAMEAAFPSMEFYEFTDYQIITGYQA
ncbi:hypothetical protein QNI16_20865 [Cytophagaceae bacterium YF14B1]|uniref:Uncharacterized protein n=1 Tax=Xanthocytophaga flava TaxID=3048013 RepID=A0AAE3QP83_9BACT|nr:hypothetical protein [Xanthocytophaga flavus]MDJ1482967.1 hypothetical protein [Xanthocytophaga flavus]